MRFICILMISFLLPGAVLAQWVEVSPMPEARYAACAAELNGMIYVIGGAFMQHGHSQESVFRYDSQNDQWSTNVADLHHRRRNAAAVAHDGAIYVFGGSENNHHSLVHEIEKYDPQQDSWQVIGSMPNPREGCVAVVHDDGIYVIGGSGSGQFAADTVERYSPQSGQWETLSALNQARISAAATVVDDMIYVIGGFDFGPLESIECYHISEGNWQTLSATLTPRGYLGACHVNDSLYAIAGSNSQGELNTVEALADDPDGQGSWQPFASLNQAREGLSVISVGNSIYAIGGRRTMPMMPVSTVERYTFTPTAIEEPEGTADKKTWLGQNFPNPFVGSTTIPLQINSGEIARLQIFSVTGQLVREWRPAASGNPVEIRWDGRNQVGETVASGTYFYRLITPPGTLTQQMVLLR